MRKYNYTIEITDINERISVEMDDNNEIYDATIVESFTSHRNYNVLKEICDNIYDVFEDIYFRGEAEYNGLKLVEV